MKLALDPNKKYWWVSMEADDESGNVCGFSRCPYMALTFEQVKQIWANAAWAAGLIWLDTEEEAKKVQDILLNAPLDEATAKMTELIETGRAIPINERRKEPIWDEAHKMRP